MAMTSWPRLSCLELPSGAAGSVTGSSTRSSARSVSGSSPTSRAVRLLALRRSSPRSARQRAAPPAPATWLLVRMRPSGATTTPEPVPPRAAALRARWRVNGQADHRRADAVDHVDDGARIGVEQRLVLGRDFRDCGCGSAAAAPVGIVQRYDLHGFSVAQPGVRRALAIPPVETDIWGASAAWQKGGSCAPMVSWQRCADLLRVRACMPPSQR